MPFRNINDCLSITESTQDCNNADSLQYLLLLQSRYYGRDYAQSCDYGHGCEVVFDLSFYELRSSVGGFGCVIFIGNFQFFSNLKHLVHQ